MGSKWYSEEYELSYFEALLLIVFVIIAVLFELVWHNIMHRSDHTYSFGSVHQHVDVDEHKELGKQSSMRRLMVKDHHGNIQHKKLYKEFISRMGAEFMTLGLLALLIFVVNQLGGFDGLAERFKGTSSDGFHYPESGSDWLHLAEVVHIELFLAVVLYFILILCLVAGSVKVIRKWEKLAKQRRSDPTLSQFVGVNHLKEVEEKDPDLANHEVWREYLIGHVLKWKTTRPDAYREALHALGIDPNASDLDEQFTAGVCNSFSLGVYLSLNVERGVVDSILIHPLTWGAIVFLLAIFALLHRFARVSILYLIPVFLVAACVFLMIMVITQHMQRRKIQQYIDAHQKCDPEGEVVITTETLPSETEQGTTCLQKIDEAYDTELMTLRLLQMGLFFICYCFARALLDKYDWEHKTLTNLIVCLVALVVFLLLAFFLPRTVPDFLAVTSLPPYVNPDNLEFMFKQFVGGSKKQI